MFPRRGRAAGAHPQAQGVQASEDAHLLLLRQELHPGDLPGQAHAEARGQVGQAAAHRGLGHERAARGGHGPGLGAGQHRQPRHGALLAAQDGRGPRLRRLPRPAPADGPEAGRGPEGLRPARPPPRGGAARQPDGGGGGAVGRGARGGGAQPQLWRQDELQRLLPAAVEHAAVLARVPRHGRGPALLPRVLRPHLLPAAANESKFRRALHQLVLRGSPAPLLDEDQELRPQSAQRRHLQITDEFVPRQDSEPPRPARRRPVKFKSAESNRVCVVQN